jgi:hypothetical protein
VPGEIAAPGPLRAGGLPGSRAVQSSSAHVASLGGEKSAPTDANTG